MGGIFMLQDYELYLSRRLAATSVRLRVYWIQRLSVQVDPVLATPDDLYEFIDSNPDWSPQTEQTIISSFRLFYQWCFANGHTTTNPAVDILRVKVPRKKSRIASDEIIKGAIAHATPDEEAMLRLGAECGLRVAEIAALHQNSRDGLWLDITGKGGITRTVYVNPELASLLDHIEATTMRYGWYFPGRNPARPVAPSTVWKRIRRLTGLNTHSLRHRAGTTVYRKSGHDLRLAQEFLGHASPATTAVYVHIEREQLIRAGESTRMPRAA